LKAVSVAGKVVCVDALCHEQPRPHDCLAATGGIRVAARGAHTVHLMGFNARTREMSGHDDGKD
jgi:hypothetical protein